MKKLCVGIVMVGLLYSPAGARDFMVEFVKENYKETELSYSDVPQIYHSIQVESAAGPKLLILTGDDINYRRWLRAFISEDAHFVARVPDEANAQFIGARAFEIDVTRIHPFQKTQYQVQEDKKDQSLTVLEDRHILVLDDNPKRSSLISQVIRRMGYRPTVLRDEHMAFNAFRIQPEKFKMIIAHHSVAGLSSDSFVDRVVKIDHKIPILYGTGYRNGKILNQSMDHFAGKESVRPTPVVLKDLQNTITDLVDKNA